MSKNNRIEWTPRMCVLEVVLEAPGHDATVKVPSKS